MYFNVEFPTTVADAIIPVTKGCDVSFTLNQLATGDPGQQFPRDFALGDTVYMVIAINRNTTLRPASWPRWGTSSRPCGPSSPGSDGPNYRRRCGEKLPYGNSRLSQSRASAWST